MLPLKSPNVIPGICNGQPLVIVLLENFGSVGNQA